jgi:hypothetical protein
MTPNQTIGATAVVFAGVVISSEIVGGDAIGRFADTVAGAMLLATFS